MSAASYYNEIDPYAAQWLRNLIAAGHIAPGDVDERSIVDVRPDDLRDYRQCHFFAGIGVWSYALRLAGWPDELAVWTGSCPCQPYSLSGKHRGFSDERHLWPSWARLTEKLRPGVLFSEQVSGADGLAWLDFVLSDLEGMGYACAPLVTTASGCGATHIRSRTFFVAHADRARLPVWDERQASGIEEVASAWREFERVHAARAWKAWDAESGLPVFTSRSAARMGQIRAFGNAINAIQASWFIRAYGEVRCAV